MLEELKNLGDEFLDKFWKTHRLERQKTITYPVVSSNNIKTDGNGACTLAIYKNTTQRHLVIGRVILFADGYTPAVPYSNAAAYGYLFTGQNLSVGAIFDMLPSSAGAQMLPNVAEYSGLNGIRLKNNEVLSFALVGGPVNTNITGTIFGFLEPTTADWEI